VTNESTSNPPEFKPSTLEEIKQVENFRLGIWLIKLISSTILASVFIVIVTFVYITYLTTDVNSSQFLVTVIKDLMDVLKTIVAP
jgi:hypothetical protein